MKTKHLVPLSKHHKFINITGQRFGMLTAIGYAGRPNGTTKWLFLCDCGNEKVIASGNVVSGETVSCGCYTRRITSERSIRHGMFKTPIYNVWDSMIQRCTNEHHKSYKDYGGRGITVCDRWKEFANFYADMGDRPSSKHSIDRIDVNGGYEPNNCRWATTSEQAMNRRTTRRYTYNGETKTIPEWAAATGLTTHQIKNRIGSGWSVEKALTTPRLRW